MRTRVPEKFKFQETSVVQRIPWIQEDEITAYELGQRMLAEIYNEPKRCNMSVWCRLFGTEKVTYTTGSYRPDPLPHELPACKTVACESGWLGILGELDNPNDSEDTIKLMTGYDAWASRWRDGHIKRPKIAEQLDLCYMTIPPNEEDGGPAVGTIDYLDCATAPFKRWLDDHRDFLKARVLRRDVGMGYGFHPVFGTASV